MKNLILIFSLFFTTSALAQELDGTWGLKGMFCEKIDQKGNFFQFQPEDPFYRTTLEIHGRTVTQFVLRTDIDGKICSDENIYTLIVVRPDTAIDINRKNIRKGCSTEISKERMTKYKYDRQKNFLTALIKNHEDCHNASLLLVYEKRH